LRESAGFTLDDVTMYLECSRAKLSRIERGEVGVHPLEVEALANIYGVASKERADLVQVARDARQKSWWHGYRDLAQDSLILIDYETAATSVWTYQPAIVFGLLQTEDYARAVLRMVEFDCEDAVIERRIDLLIRRQTLLDQGERPNFSIVLDEAILRRPVGEPETMRMQLDRLIEAADHPKVRLHILPFQVGEHPGLNGAFTIFRFSQGGPWELTDRCMVTKEHGLGYQILHEPEVNRYIQLSERISNQTYDTEDSRTYLLQLRGEL
jgi:hypothetical protein